MPRSLIDPPVTVFLFIGTLVIILGALWYREPTRRALVRFAVVAALVGGYWLFAAVFESPREEAVRRMQAMADASVARNLDELFKHVSKKFQYKGGLDAAGLRASAERAPAEWGGAAVSGFDRDEVVYVDDKTVKIGFFATAKGLGVVFWCVATFQKESDGAYRLVTFLLYNPIQKDTVAPEVVPGLG